MKKVAITSIYIIGGLFLVNKLLVLLNKKSKNYNEELTDFEVPEFVISKGSSGVPQYKPPKQIEVYNIDMYAPDRNRQGETLAGDSKNMCRQYGTCPPSMDRNSSFW
tara:strand:+ start:194 stop:514 length:321 start_codon:yes stop_codon:yes gene_type:complete